jgi:nicotinamidase-related amidase
MRKVNFWSKEMKVLDPPSFYVESEKNAAMVWQVPYEDRLVQAIEWRKQHNVKAAIKDGFKICLMAIDDQVTFCLPPNTKIGPFIFGGELYVGGQDGMGAVNDIKRMSRKIYEWLLFITEICLTMDTHTIAQIFHQVFLVDKDGNHPGPYTIITRDDIKSGKWMINPGIAYIFDNPKAFTFLQDYLLHYSTTLEDTGKYALNVWPFHAMLGGLGHTIMPILEEAAFFHAITRQSRVDFQIKGGNPLTENFSVLSPEVLVDQNGKPIAQKNKNFIEKLLKFDAVIIGGQAKSHCVAWTIDDLLKEIKARDPLLAKKVYLVEDWTSPVVIPGVVDFTQQADDAFQRFADEGMNVVNSNTPLDQWPGIQIAA